MPLYSFSKVVSDDFDGKVDMTLRNWFCLIYWCAKAFLPLAELSETQAACQSSLCSRKGRHVVNGSGFEEPWLHLRVLRVEVNDGVSRLGSRVLVSLPTPLSWLFRMVLRTKRSFVIAEFKMNLLITNKSFRDQSSVTVQENSWLLHTGCTFLMYHWLTASCLRIDPGKKAGFVVQGPDLLQAFYWITDKQHSHATVKSSDFCFHLSYHQFSSPVYKTANLRCFFRMCQL